MAVDVVVPARDEQHALGPCLRALMRDSDGLDLRVIVAANGCTDGTAAVARAVAPLAREQRCELFVIETARAGKTVALNAADARRRGCTAVYLDADTVLLPGALRALVAALEPAARPRLAAPRAMIARPETRLARSFARVWSSLPAVGPDVLGAGCYAVNAAGRARWASFPELTADDGYVRARFAPAERVVVDGASLFVLPEGRDLVRAMRRWRRGNRELRRTDAVQRSGARGGDPSAGLRRNLASIAARPMLWPQVPAFLLLTALARLPAPSLRRASGRRPDEWKPARERDTPRQVAGGSS